MPTYVTTVKFTEQGVKAIGDTTKRGTAFKTAAKKLGVKVSSLYWTLGHFDGLLVFDAPDDETATAAMLQVSSQGNVTTTTSRAFTAAEMDAILAKL